MIGIQFHISEVVTKIDGLARFQYFLVGMVLE